MAGIRLLDAIHRKSPDSVYAQLVKLGIVGCRFIGSSCLAHLLTLLFNDVASETNQPRQARFKIGPD